MLLRPILKLAAGILALVALAVPTFRVLLPGVLEPDPPSPHNRVRILIHTPVDIHDLSVNVEQSVAKNGELTFRVSLYSPVTGGTHDVNIAVFVAEGYFLPELKCKQESLLDPSTDPSTVKKFTEASEIPDLDLRRIASATAPGVVVDDPQGYYFVSTRLYARGAERDRTAVIPQNISAIQPRALYFSDDDLSCTLSPGASVGISGTSIPRDGGENADRKMLNFARVNWTRLFRTVDPLSALRDQLYDPYLPTDGTMWQRWSYEVDSQYQRVDSTSPFEYKAGRTKKWTYDEKPIQVESPETGVCTLGYCLARDVWVYLQKTDYERTKNTKSFLLGLVVSLLTATVGFTARAGRAHIRERRASAAPPPPPAAAPVYPPHYPPPPGGPRIGG